MSLVDGNGGGLSAADVASMMDEAKTDHERKTVEEWINRLSSN